MENNELMEKISRKMSVLISLFMEESTKKQNTTEKVSFLKRFGINSQEMAEIIGTTKNTVDVTVSNLKKKNNS